jgi:hypothetical protein
MVAMIVLAVLVLALQIGRVTAREESLVTAESVLDRFVDATGGRETYEKLKTRISRGTVLRTSMDDLSLLTVYETASTSRYWLSRSESLGEQEEGSIGECAWSCSLMSGPHLKKGAELADALRTAPIDAPLRWRESFTKVDYAGTKELFGKICHVVKGELHGSGPETQYYEADSGLLVRIELTLHLEGSELPGVITFEEYRDVDGLLLPHTIRRDHASIDEMVIKIEEIDHETPIPSSVFVPPEEILTLIDRN